MERDLDNETGKTVRSGEMENDEEVEEVWEELLESAIWELSFDVHRAVKLNYLFLDNRAILDYLFLDSDLDPFPEQRRKNRAAEKDASDAKSKQKKVLLECPDCNRRFGETKLGTHLSECLGIVSGRNASVRESSRKKETQTPCVDENESGAESGGSSGRKIPKKTRGKTPKKSKAGGSSKSPAGNNDVFGNMTYEEKAAFLKEKCGVLTQKNKRCLNSIKCTQHQSEEKKLVREAHLRNADDCANNDKVNEAVDEDDSEKSFT